MEYTLSMEELHQAVREWLLRKDCPTGPSTRLRLLVTPDKGRKLLRHEGAVLIDEDASEEV